MEEENWWGTETYCELAGFFALEADEQRKLIPPTCEPIYASFNEGDGTYYSPLLILFRTLADCAISLTTHIPINTPGLPSVSEKHNEALVDVIHALEKVYFWQKDFISEFPPFDVLDDARWDDLRKAARVIWDNFEEQHRLPFSHWADYAG